MAGHDATALRRVTVGVLIMALTSRRGPDSIRSTTATSPRGLLTSGLAANGVGLGLSVVIVTLTALVLGAEGRGQIAVMTVVASYAVVAVGLSLESGILHFGRSPEVGTSPVFRHRVAGLVLTTFVVAIVLLTLAAGIAVRPQLSGLVLVVFAVGYAAPVLVIPATALDRLDGRHHAATWRPVWVLVAQQLGGAAGLLLSPSASNFLLGGGLASLGAVVLTIHLHRRGTPPLDDASVVDGVVPGIGSLVTYSLSGHGGVLLHLFTMRAPLIVVSAFLGSAAAGRFSIATALAEMSLIVSQSQLGRVLAAATSAPTEFTVLRREILVGLALSSGLGCVISSAAYFAPVVLGPEFLGLFWPTVFLVPGVVALGAWRLATNDLAARGHAAARTVSAAGGAIVVGVLLVVLVESLGLLGAAISASVGFVVMPIILWFLPLNGAERPTTGRSSPSRSAGNE